MSNQQDENNFTQIPNVIFDYWMNALSLAQFKVFLCICRKLYGWHKIQDQISIKQIMKMTGLGNKAVIRIINELILIGLIIKIKSKETCGDDACNLFYINNEVMIKGSVLKTLPSVTKTQGVVSQRHKGVVSQRHKGVVSQGHSQKKDHTKKTNTKKTTTTTKTSVVVAVPFVENLEFASRICERLEKDVKRLKWPKEWIISKEIFVCLFEKYGQHFVCDQLNYMIGQEENFLKTKKETLIKNPPTYIKMACEENWASSLKNKEKI